MPKATVIEVFKGRAVIMTEQCEFKEIKTRRPLQAGEEIEYTPRALSPRPGPLPAAAWAASFLICCLLAYYTVQYLTFHGVNARIGLEINPSLEISINKDYIVVGAMAFNKDGQDLIANKDLEGKTLDAAVSEVIGQCIDKKYLHDNGNLIGVSLASETSNPRLPDRVQEVMGHALASRKVKAAVYYFALDQATRDEAIKRGVSPLRYFLWKRAKRSDVSIPLRSTSLDNPVIREMARKTAIAVLEQGWVERGTGDVGLETKPMDNGNLTEKSNPLPGESEGGPLDHGSASPEPVKRPVAAPDSPTPGVQEKEGNTWQTTSPLRDGDNTGLSEDRPDNQTSTLNPESSQEPGGQSNAPATGTSPGSPASGETSGGSETGGTAGNDIALDGGGVDVSGNGGSSSGLGGDGVGGMVNGSTGASSRGGGAASR